MSGLTAAIPIASLQVFARAQLGHGPLRFAASMSSTSPAAPRLAVVCAGGPVVHLAPRTLADVAVRDDHGAAGACDAAFSVDGRVCASGGADGAVVVDDVVDGAPRTRRLAGRGWVERVSVSADGARVAAARGRTLLVVDVATLQVLAEHTLPATPTAVAFFDRVLAAATYGGVHVWSDGGVGKERVYATKAALLSLVQSPDAKFFAAGCLDATVHCWRRSSGDDFAMSGYPQKVVALAFSPDSRFLATGGGDVISVWDFSGAGPQGTEPRELVGHAKSVSALAFSGPRRLWSAGADGAVILWDLTRGRGAAPIAVFAHDAPGVCVVPVVDAGPSAASVAFADGAVFTLVDPA